MNAPMNAARLTDAFAATESITRSQARNFYYGIRLLPRAKRTALCAVYALARRIDDIGDGDIGDSDGDLGDGDLGDGNIGDGETASAERKLRQLTELSAQLDSIDRAAESGDPVLMAVAEVSRHFPIPLGAFQELIEGVQLDVRGARYQTFEELTQYCRYVAGSIGRLCLGVFGSQPTDPAAPGHAAAPDYADALGIGLQQTNILRDIREDLLAGRVYLPAEDLDRFGVRLRLDDDGRLVDEDGRLSELIRFSARRAGNWYAEGLKLLPLLDWRSRSSCAAMAGIYRQLLGRIAADPTLVFGGRLSLSGTDKGRIAVRALMGAPA
jgi:phytoene synthase